MWMNCPGCYGRIEIPENANNETVFSCWACLLELCLPSVSIQGVKCDFVIKASERRLRATFDLTDCS